MYFAGHKVATTNPLIESRSTVAYCEGCSPTSIRHQTCNRFFQHCLILCWHLFSPMFPSDKGWAVAL